jgi:hypothetical protein
MKRVLFDQATPVPMRPFLTGYEVVTAAQQGWDRLQNGNLILAAEDAGFDVFLTTDKNIRYQQNLTERRIAIILLGKQQWLQLRGHVACRSGSPCGSSRKLYRSPNS